MTETKTMAEALCAAQKQMQNPKKDKTAEVRTKTGGKYTYNYTTLDAVLDVVRPALNDNGIFLSQRSESVDGGMMLHTCVMHGESRYELDATPYQYDSDPQEFGKRETYARRYSLLKAFGLAGDEDMDGDTGAGGTTPPVRTEPNPETRRKRMLKKCASLAAKCIENGMKAGATESYMAAKWGVESMDELTDEQIVEFGSYLADMEKQSAEIKAQKASE